MYQYMEYSISKGIMSVLRGSLKMLKCYHRSKRFTEKERCQGISHQGGQTEKDIGSRAWELGHGGHSELMCRAEPFHCAGLQPLYPAEDRECYLATLLSTFSPPSPRVTSEVRGCPSMDGLASFWLKI